MNQNKEETYILRLYNIFRKMIRNEIRYTVHDAVVTAVDESKFTFDAKILETEYFGIPLNVLKSEQASIVEVPKNGTDCILTFREFSKARPQALKFHELDKILVTVGTSFIEIKNDEIIFNGGENKGLVKLKELEESLDSLKKYVEAINSALPSAFSAVGASPAASGAAGGASYTASMADKSIIIKDLENPKIKQ